MSRGVVLVCGGRSFADRELVSATLDAFDPCAVVTGGARGADALASEWARSRGRDLRNHPADWAAHGKAAGPIRNQTMLDEERPDLVVAFPGGRGTADMVRRAEAAGVKVVRITAHGGIIR